MVLYHFDDLCAFAVHNNASTELDAFCTFFRFFFQLLSLFSFFFFFYFFFTLHLSLTLWNASYTFKRPIKFDFLFSRKFLKRIYFFISRFYLAYCSIVMHKYTIYYLNEILSFIIDDGVDEINCVVYMVAMVVKIVLFPEKYPLPFAMRGWMVYLDSSV